MKQGNDLGKFAILFLPWLFSLLFAGAPAVSYLVAWGGSFFIFYFSLSGKVKPLPTDRPLGAQLMRPIFIVQIIFAGYMACTSIFYFFSVLGYRYLEEVNSLQLVDPDKLEITAQCQRYYCLAHASFVAGILYFMNYPVKKSTPMIILCLRIFYWRWPSSCSRFRSFF